MTIGQLSVDTLVRVPRGLAPRDQCLGSFATSPGGTAAIVAHNAAVLGASRVTFVGHVGRSPQDRTAIRRLRAAGVSIGPTVCSPAGLRVLVLVDGQGERTMVSDGAEPDWASLSVKFAETDVTLFEAWPLFSASGAGGYIPLIEQAAASGATVVLDVCSASRGQPESFSQLLHSLPLHVVLANRDEARTYHLLERPPAPVVVAHCGTRPTRLSVEGRRRTIHVDEVPAVDASGAGDTFAAGFLLALTEGADPASAAVCGNQAARAAVRVAGPLLPLPTPVTSRSA